MPSGVVNSAAQLGYAIIESAFATAAAPTNTSAFRVISLNSEPRIDQRQRPDKNGTLSRQLGIPGVRSATWSARASLAGSSGPGVAGDFGPFLQAAFGKAPTVAAGVSVTYALDDLSPSLSIYSYWKPSTATQDLVIGAVVDRLSIDATGGGDPTIEVSGPGLWRPDTDSFADLDATGKGGLSSFAAEPGAPVTNGNMIDVTAGSATIDGYLIPRGVRSFRLNMGFGRSIPTDVLFGGKYGAEPQQIIRDITFDMNIYDYYGDADWSRIKKKAVLKTPITCTFVFGGVAAHTLAMTLNNVQLGNPITDDGQPGKAIAFSGCVAHAISNTSKDETVFVYT